MQKSKVMDWETMKSKTFHGKDEGIWSNSCGSGVPKTQAWS